ncbi:MAG: ion transporter [Bdellovibrionales bacterium]|nr:ion transporter [Bdellovibrionales bacterium]
MRKDDRRAPWQVRLGHIIYESDTPAGKAFDVVLLVAIVASVLVVMLDSVQAVASRHGTLLLRLEWFFTVLFSLEYALRVLTAHTPRRYVFSFYGLVDLLAVVPTYVSLLAPGSQYLIVLRAVRLLRIFRVLKLARYLGEAEILHRALAASRWKILVFVYTVLTVVCIIGTLMYLIEGPTNGFTSIPISIYWSIVTLTTVGYGDIAPQTTAGQLLASAVMILGYGIIAVPTGIVTVELSRASAPPPEDGHGEARKRCAACSTADLPHQSKYCYRCGEPVS